jgi:hypothetical protein
MRVTFGIDMNIEPSGYMLTWTSVAVCNRIEIKSSDLRTMNHTDGLSVASDGGKSADRGKYYNAQGSDNFPNTSHVQCEQDFWWLTWCVCSKTVMSGVHTSLWKTMRCATPHS